jgi:hypothetical protein
MLTLKDVEEIRPRLNKRLEELNLSIKVDANFIMMLCLLLEELEAKKSE